jgi:hypothetical protein
MRARRSSTHPLTIFNDQLQYRYYSTAFNAGSINLNEYFTSVSFSFLGMVVLLRVVLFVPAKLP